jgi:FdhE protein
VSGGDASALGIPAGAAPLRLPGDGAALFARRAARLRELATGHAAADWLATLARLCDAQAQAIAEVAPTLPAIARARTAAEPLHLVKWRREPLWRQLLDAIVAVMSTVELPPPARAGLDQVAAAGADERESCAEALLTGAALDLDPAGAPLVAAALQAYWTARASALDAAAATGRAGPACPVCAAPPVAAVVQGDDKVRYVCCALCSSEWHRARVQCIICASGAALSYQAIAGGPPGVKAETCQTCMAYLKLFFREERPGAEALADDAATLALDLLLGEAGLGRCGVNLLVTPTALAR